MGLQARFSIRNTAGYEEINLSCRFPELPAARSHPPRRRHRKRNRQRDRDKPTLRSISAQTEPLVHTTPPHHRRHVSPSPLAQAALTSPPPEKSPSPSAPPPAKKTRKRRCELELLRSCDDDLSQSLLISPPILQPIPSARSPSPR